MDTVIDTLWPQDRRTFEKLDGSSTLSRFHLTSKNSTVHVNDPVPVFFTKRVLIFILLKEGNRDSDRSRITMEGILVFNVSRES